MASQYHAARKCVHDPATDVARISLCALKSVIAVEYAMYRTLINLSRCPRCGGEMEFRATIESREKKSDVRVFQCRCGHIECDTDEDNKRSADGRPTR
jgi:hypothetical protein